MLPLQEAAERFGALRRAARQAIAEIQARLEGVSPGQLSLAATEAGQLSLATETGQLLLALIRLNGARSRLRSRERAE